MRVKVSFPTENQSVSPWNTPCCVLWEVPPHHTITTSAVAPADPLRTWYEFNFAINRIDHIMDWWVHFSSSPTPVTHYSGRLALGLFKAKVCHHFYCQTMSINISLANKNDKCETKDRRVVPFSSPTATQRSFPDYIHINMPPLCGGSVAELSLIRRTLLGEIHFHRVFFGIGI